MNGQDTPIYGYSDPAELVRRDSKRRRVLTHHLVGDVTNPQLDWQVSQPSPANFYDASATSPTRMHHSPDLVPGAPSGWGPQTLQPLPDFQSYDPEVAAYGSHPYFQGQIADGYAASWPPTVTQSIYGSATAPAIGLLPEPHDSPGFHDGMHLFGPKMLYNTTSLADGYAPISPYGDASTLNKAMVDPAPLPQYHPSQLALPELDRLATQIVQTVARSSHLEFQELLQGTSAASQDYLNTAQLFEQARRTIVPGHGFIEPNIYQVYHPAQQDIIRRVNIAVFLTSVLGATNIPFFHLDQVFLEVFVPLGHRLLKWQGTIYLELKTQTYILALVNSGALPETLLDEIFPLDFETKILERHPDAPSLSPSEQDFIDRCRARRQYLCAESYSLQARSELPHKYPSNDFIREFLACISKNLDHVLSPSHRQSAMHGVFNRRRAGSGPVSYDHGLADGGHHDGVRRSVSNGGHVRRVDKKTTASGQTVRQVWVKAEEEALIAGLERVGGPHWSQILALYGRGGSISEVLKDRNQVQLKDKARNLKLWYLKMGQEVPIPLRGVTGELRKRGGARARAALEAEELGLAAKDRRSSDEQEVDPMLGVRHDTVDPGAYDRTRKN